MKLHKLYVAFVCLICFCTAAAMEESMDILHAAGNGKTKRVKLLLTNNPDLVNVQDNFGWTPLHMASSGGDTKIAALLLQDKADVNAQDNFGWTSLHMASCSGHTETAKLLLSYGAIPYSPINLFERYFWFSKLYAQGHQAFINKVKKEREKVFLILYSIERKEGNKGVELPRELCNKIAALAFSGIKEWHQFKKAHPEIAALADAQEEEPS